MEQEIWKAIKDHEGVYELSNLGRIKRLGGLCKSSKDGLFRTVKERIMTPGKNKKGYHRVCLSNKPVSYKYYTVHRLIAKHFIPNPFNKPQVNHINGIKTDNTVVNLEWATCQENAQHAHDTGLNKSRKGVPNPLSSYQDQQMAIECFDKNGNFIGRYDSISSAGRILGVRQGVISNSLKLNPKNPKRFSFKKVTNEQDIHDKRCA